MKQQNAFQLASIQIGGAICLPLLLVGYELAKENSLITLLLAIMWGNLILFSLALAAGSLSLARRLPTASHASYYFGKYGKQVFGLILSLTMLGWFGIQSQCMGQDVSHWVISEENSSTWQLFFSFLISLGIIVLALRGVVFLEKMANICVPLMLGTIGYAIYNLGVFDKLDEIVSGDIVYWSPKAISLIIASSIGATIDLPTFYQYAKSQRDTTWASFLTYLLATPFVQFAGACLYYATHAPTLGKALAIDSSPGWQAWVVFFMLLAGWTTNNLNLFSAKMSLQAMIRHGKASAFIAALIALFFSIFPLLANFTRILELMGMITAVIGGIILVAYFCENWFFPFSEKACWISAVFGMLFGLSSFFYPDFGSEAALFDAVAATGLMLIINQILSWYRQRQLNLKEQVYEPNSHHTT